MKKACITLSVWLFVTVIFVVFLWLAHMESTGKPDGLSFNEDLAKILVNLTGIATVILTVVAVVAAVWGVFIAMGFFENLEKRVLDEAAKVAKNEVNQLEAYIEARTAFSASYDLATIAWDWGHDYEPTTINNHIAGMFFVRIHEAITKFRKLVKDDQMSATYEKQSYRLLGSALTNLIFFTCKQGDDKLGLQVIEWADELKARSDFKDRTSLVHTYIYAQIVYAKAFAEELKCSPTAVLDAADKSIRLEESKGKGLHEDDRAELVRLKAVLKGRRDGQNNT